MKSKSIHIFDNIELGSSSVAHAAISSSLLFAATQDGATIKCHESKLPNQRSVVIVSDTVVLVAVNDCVHPRHRAGSRTDNSGLPVILPSGQRSHTSRRVPECRS